MRGVDQTGAFWIDYIADVGEGFEATYTMAYLLAQDSLDIRGAGKLRHGEVLIMGGDQCYPQATREEYKQRLLQPFNWAFGAARPDRKLFAIPGNHDWYDGLNGFDSLFCSSRDKLSTPGATSSAAGSASSIAATGRYACPTTGGSGVPTSNSRSTWTPPRSTTSCAWRSRWDRRTI